MVLSALAALIIGIVHRKKLQDLKFMVLYPMVSLVQGLLTYYSWIHEKDKELWGTDTVSDSLFILFEFLIIYQFFKKAIVIERLKLFIKIIFLFNVTYLLLMWVLTDTFYKNPSKIYLIDSLCILSFCFIYFFQLFRLPPKLNLLNNTQFWITIGLLFYFSCTIPLFFADNILIVFPGYYKLYSINFLAYTILFLFISKAFLCTPTTMKQSYL